MFARRTMDRLRRRPLGRYRYVRLRWRLLFAAIDLVGGWLFRLVRAWRVASGARRCDPLLEREGVRVILLVQLDHLGDAVLSTTLLPPLPGVIRGPRWKC